MMKRALWTGVGYSLGLASSLYVQRRVRRTVQRYAPEHVRQEVSARSRIVAERARGIVIDLREAAAEGAAAMRREEVDLREQFAASEPSHRGPARSIDESRRSTGGSRPRY